MRRIPVVGMIILSLVAMPLVVAAAPATEKKTEICHVTGDGEGHVITVSVNAVDNHLTKHEDTMIDADHLAEDCGSQEDVEIVVPTLTASFTIVDDYCLSMTYCEVVVDASATEGDIETYIWLGTNLDYPSLKGATGKATTIGGLLPGNNVIRLDVKGFNGDTDFIEKPIFLTAPLP